MLLELIAPNKEETPARCRLKIAKSTDPPECACIPDKGMAVKFIIKIHKINININWVIIILYLYSFLI